MPPRHRRPRVSRHFKIDHDLRPQDREPYLAHLREPRTTIDVAHAWLVEKGYPSFSRSAVARHRRHYLEGRGQQEESARRAQMYAGLAASKGAPDFVAGAMLQAEHLLFEQVWLLKDEWTSRETPLSPAELQPFLEALSAAIEARAKLTKLQRSSRLRATPPEARPQRLAQPAEPRFETIAREVRRLLGIPTDQTKGGPGPSDN